MLWRRYLNWPVAPGDRWTMGWKRPVSQKPSRPWIHVVLFLATVITTTTAGAMNQGVNPLATPFQLYRGLPFSITLLLILGVHEFGHYFASRRWNVQATLPYFIPMPFFLIGTMGAVIRIRSPIPNRKALFDIGVAGPLAGLVLAVPALIYGLSLSSVEPVEGLSGLMLTEGNSLLYLLLKRIVVGGIPPGHDVMLHPIAFAAWIGMFVTALNLLPIGQLDGGHIVYALFGGWHSVIASGAMLALIPLGFFTKWYGWLFLFVMILLVLGRRHPPPYDPYTELDPRRRTLGWIMILIFVLCFIPVPLTVTGP